MTIAPPEGDQGSTPFASRPKVVDDGCAKPMLLGCGALVLFVTIALVALASKSDDILRWSLDNIETQIQTALPEETPPEDRQRLRDAFDGVSEHLLGGRADAADLVRLQTAFLDFSESARDGIESREALRFAAALEEITGRQPADAASPRPAGPFDSADEDGE